MLIINHTFQKDPLILNNSEALGNEENMISIKLMNDNCLGGRSRLWHQVNNTLKYGDWDAV